jgi:hypothetical protein
LGKAEVLQLVIDGRADVQWNRRRRKPAQLVLCESCRVGLAGRRHLVEAVDIAIFGIDIIVEVIEVFEAGEAMDHLHQPHAVTFHHYHARPEANVCARARTAEHHQHGGVHPVFAQTGAEHVFELIGIDLSLVDGPPAQHESVDVG